MPTYADAVIGALKDVGVRRLFGMPGGGSNADLIQAAVRADLPFSLAQAETPSAFMATAQAEVTGDPGACLATLGPGAASMTNGIANAHLDRVPLVVLTDCRTSEAAAVMQHQTLAHGEIFASMVKASARPAAGDAARAIQAVMDAVVAPPSGPVHLDLAVELTSANVVDGDVVHRSRAPAAPSGARLAPDIERVLRESRHPVFLLGLGARSDAVTTQIREMVTRFGIPALVTYKAKGVVADRDPWFAGVLTNGALERDVLAGADVFIAVGLDPVELLPRPWSLPQPIVAINAWSMVQRQLPIRSEIVGDVVEGLRAVGACLGGRSGWDCVDVRRMADSQTSRMRPSGEPGRLLPHRVVELVGDVYAGARITVDAGAHMFPVMSLWSAATPRSVLISNGLATMGFALPAAIGAALLDRDRPTVAFTGDGGLLMCVAELLTAVREQAPVRVVVFDDSTLSLIKIKQTQRGYDTRGVVMGHTQWAAVGRAFGVTVREAADEVALAEALQTTIDEPGPVLIAAQIAAETYEPTIRALRG
jgi:acetolactate synthase I/II/III large subunit